MGTVTKAAAADAAKHTNDTKDRTYRRNEKQVERVWKKFKSRSLEQRVNKNLFPFTTEDHLEILDLYIYLFLSELLEAKGQFTFLIQLTNKTRSNRL